MQLTSDDSPACSCVSRQPDLRQPPTVAVWGAVVVGPGIAMARRPASKSTASSPNAPEMGDSSPGPFLTTRAAPRNSWAGIPMAACPYRRRSEAAAGIGMT